MKGTECAQSANPPFQKIEDAVRTTGLSAYFLRRGCRDGFIPHIKSGTVYLIDMEALLTKLHDAAESNTQTGGERRWEISRV